MTSFVFWNFAPFYPVLASHKWFLYNFAAGSIVGRVMETFCGCMEMEIYCGSMEMEIYCGSTEMETSCDSMEMETSCHSMEMETCCGSVEMKLPFWNRENVTDILSAAELFGCREIMISSCCDLEIGIGGGTASLILKR
jgi:hypothetical protein